MKSSKINIGNALLGLLLVVLLIALLYSVPSAISMFKASENKQSNLMPRISRMSLTSFDEDIARQTMDKNHDGICDVCGMPVEQCIASGQIECNMGSSAKIGVLGSQHIHADWKIYINNKELDLSDKYYGRVREGKPASSFVHVEPSTGEKTGDVVHMHAKGVPLWLFFKSIGMDFNKDCITLENKEKFCNDGNKKLKFFVNGKENNEFENYVFNDLDKILISYGNENEEEIKNQLDEITDFAKVH